MIVAKDVSPLLSNGRLRSTAPKTVAGFRRFRHIVETDGALPSLVKRLFLSAAAAVKGFEPMARRELAAAAALGYAAVALLLRRARRRLGAGEGSFISVYGDVIALALAGLSILFPPIGLVGIAAFVVLLVRTRGSGGQKYEGLRILR